MACIFSTNYVSFVTYVNYFDFIYSVAIEIGIVTSQLFSWLFSISLAPVASIVGLALEMLAESVTLIFLFMLLSTVISPFAVLLPLPEAIKIGVLPVGGNLGSLDLVRLELGVLLPVRLDLGVLLPVR